MSFYIYVIFPNCNFRLFNTVHVLNVPDIKLNHKKTKLLLKFTIETNKLLIFVFVSVSGCDKYNPCVECYLKQKMYSFTK